MGKQPRLLCTCMACMCILQLISCTKPPKDFDPRDANNVYTGCRIKSVNGTPVVYNANNDPVSFEHSGVASTGSPNIYFKYDNKNKLIEYTALDGNGSYEFLHRYTYDRQQIIVDTMYVFGSYGVPNSYAIKRISYPAYDEFSRVARDSVVETTSFGPGPSTYITTYTYTAAGNLYTSVTYDDKLNFHRTNKVWMFIDRNYSVNNPAPANNYNNSGLPLSFPAKNGLDFNFTYYYYTGAAMITYDCK